MRASPPPPAAVAAHPVGRGDHGLAARQAGGAAAAGRAGRPGRPDGARTLVRAPSPGRHHAAVLARQAAPADRRSASAPIVVFLVGALYADDPAGDAWRGAAVGGVLGALARRGRLGSRDPSPAAARGARARTRTDGARVRPGPGGGGGRRRRGAHPGRAQGGRRSPSRVSRAPCRSAGRPSSRWRPATTPLRCTWRSRSRGPWARTARWRAAVVSGAQSREVRRGAPHTVGAPGQAYVCTGGASWS